MIEFKIRSKALESLPSVLRDAEAIFERNHYLYFGYLRKRGWRDETKDIKIRGCIYYLYTLVISKQILSFNMRDLIKEITKEEIEFTKEIASKSGIDLDEEELYGVGNIIKEIKLVRRLEEKDQIIKDKEKQLEDKEKQLEEERELRLEKEREIKRLKTQLEEK